MLVLTRSFPVSAIEWHWSPPVPTIPLVGPQDHLSDDLVGAARTIIVLCGAGNELSDVVRSHTKSEAMVANNAMMTAALLRLHGPMRPSEIAGAISVTTGGATKIVNRLARDGIVRKSPEGKDGRAVIVELTDEGVSLVDSLLRDFDSVLRALAARLRFERSPT
jgi:DNA-binding MarR family transcriptional regulator